MKKIFLTFLPSLILLTNCATVVRGTTEPFKVITDPPGARVTTTLETNESIKARKTSPELTPIFHGCEPTPCEIKVPRRSKFVARVEHNGFEPTRIVVRSKAGLITSATNSATTTTAVAGGLAATSTGVLTGVAAAGITVAGGTVYASPLLATDALSGALLNLYPNPVSLKLHPVGTEIKKNYDLNELNDPNQTYTNFLDPHNNNKEKTADKAAVR